MPDLVRPTFAVTSQNGRCRRSGETPLTVSRRIVLRGDRDRCMDVHELITTPPKLHAHNGKLTADWRLDDETLLFIFRFGAA
jgi:hypothetical protein